MKALEQQVERLTGDLNKLTEAKKRNSKATGTATGNIQRMGIAFRTTLGPIVALYGALNFLNKSLQVAAERQVNVAKLTNGLRNLGGTAADLEQLVATADRLGKATLFDQEDFSKAFAFLTSFQRIGVDSYERVTKAAADLATITGQDLNSAMTQLSKALEDPARRVTDLARSGTVFTEQQKEQIKTLQESGRLFEAQNLILAEIEKQYGGAAEAAGKSGLAGALDTLGESTRDYQEALANTAFLVDTLTAAINSLAGAIDGAQQGLKDADTIIKAIGIVAEQAGLSSINFAKGVDFVKEAILNALPQLKLYLWALEQVNKLAGQVVDSQAGTRNFGSNYASQEKELFKKAGSWSPYSNKPPTVDPPKPTTSGGGKSAADEAARRLEVMQKQLAVSEKLITAAERESELLKATTDEEALRIESKNKIFEIAEKYGELAAKSLSDAETENLLKAQGLEIQNERIALEEKLAEIEAKRFEGIDEEIAHMEAILAGTEQEYLLRRKIAELGGGPEAEAKVMRHAQLEKEVEAYKEMEQTVTSLSGTLAGEMTSAFGSIIDGSKSAEEAMADMLENIGKAFIDMALQIIQKQLQMILYGMIMKALGIAMPGAGGASAGSSAVGAAGSVGVDGLVFDPTTTIPMAANGGPAMANTPMIVGERGPELFMPSSSGRIASHETMNNYMPGGSSGGGGGGSVMVNYSGPQLNFNGDDYLPKSAVGDIINEAAMRGAKMGEARTVNNLRNNRSTRTRAGV